jgi:hypothetical protein
MRTCASATSSNTASRVPIVEAMELLNKAIRATSATPYAHILKNYVHFAASQVPVYVKHRSYCALADVSISVSADHPRPCQV